MTKQVVGSMSEWAGILRDLFRQIDDGSITKEQLQNFLEHKNPFETKSILSTFLEWQPFYRDLFGIDLDVTDLSVSKKQPGFDRLIVVVPGMTPQKLYGKCKGLFPCWKYTDKSLDEVVIHSDRTAKGKPYAIWVRDRVEADEELKNKSANQLKQEDIPGITLEERLLYEIKYFQETGKHLDIDNVTLCSGSRDDDGFVPRVYWSVGKLRVYWFGPVNAFSTLRARQAVS